MSLYERLLFHIFSRFLLFLSFFSRSALRSQCTLWYTAMLSTFYYSFLFSIIVEFIFFLLYLRQKWMYQQLRSVPTRAKVMISTTTKSSKPHASMPKEQILSVKRHRSLPTVSIVQTSITGIVHARGKVVG